MKNKIVIAGGTGNLGQKIIKSLLKQGAEVHAIVRSSSDKLILDELNKMGVQVLTVNMNSPSEIISACTGARCVVSAVAGLHETIVDMQSLLLEAALAAGVPHFIPSDFCCDFTRVKAGDNRNLDFRRVFNARLDKTSIAATSIFCGAFTDILGYNTPFYNLKDYSVSYWGDNANWKVDFTTIDNTADYTAAVAMDPKAPRYLLIASFQVSAHGLARLGEEIKSKSFKLIPMGSLDDFAAYNKRERAANPSGENELYPAWQNNQYLHSMFSVHNEMQDNFRYPHVKWESAWDVLEKIN